MRKWVILLLSTVAALPLILTVYGTSARTNAGSYGEDRARIEDLQARYLFALDFYDLDTDVSTFTEDGVLDIIGYKVKGRDAIRKALEDARAVFNVSGNEDAQKPYPATGRHNITNIVLKIDGDRAVGRAYWFHYGNNNPERRAEVDAYGHYEDELVKVNGQWLFSKRVIYNENNAEWIAPAQNPSW